MENPKHLPRAVPYPSISIRERFLDNLLEVIDSAVALNGMR